MACYFGCSTGSNKAAYCLYFTLLLSSIGLWIGFVVSSAVCVSDAPTTAACESLVSSVDNAVAFEVTTTAGPAAPAAPAAAPNVSSAEICESYGFAQGSTEFQDCDECITGFYHCVSSSAWLFYTAIVIGVLTFLPCFFCCCCARSPGKPYSL